MTAPVGCSTRPPNKAHAVTSVAWLQDVPSIIKNCKAPGPLYLSALSEGELRHLNNMMGRLYQLAEAATAVRSLKCVQPAVDAAPGW